VASPLGLCAVELNVVALAASSLPRHEGKILYFADPYTSEDGNALLLHERVIGCGLLLELAETGFFIARWLVPVAGVFIVGHEISLDKSF
jgi:hypothetical protein